MSIDSTSAGSKTTVPAIEDTLCACPKHPVGQQNRSGSYPKRRITLEPKTARAGADDQESAELRDMTNALLDRRCVDPACIRPGQGSHDPSPGWTVFRWIAMRRVGWRERTSRKGQPYQEAAGRTEACCDVRRRDEPALRLRHWQRLAAKEK